MTLYKSTLTLALAIFSYLGAIAQNSSFVILELYTSEGCSSCPPAERLMPELKETYGDSLYILEFHVDYWNRLGWRDQYSKTQYSNRQRQYAQRFNIKSVYTPQAIINGQAHEVGSKKEQLHTLIDNALGRSNALNKISLTVKQKAYNQLSVKYVTHLSNGEKLYIALVQQHATTDVKAGENNGKELEHHYIVRELAESEMDMGSLDMYIPEGESQSPYYIIAFIQDKQSMIIKDIQRSILFGKE